MLLFSSIISVCQSVSAGGSNGELRSTQVAVLAISCAIFLASASCDMFTCVSNVLTWSIQFVNLAIVIAPGIADKYSHSSNAPLCHSQNIFDADSLDQLIMS
jgi:hypothetical protein